VILFHMGEMMLLNTNRHAALTMAFTARSARMMTVVMAVNTILATVTHGFIKALMVRPMPVSTQ
jgi:hypothetical protein